ncbi:MAG: hypothetical protein LBN23_04580, partial [Paludibacter sp.]|nr:hypothetical protein [Paludibacter sp.]
ISGFQPCFSELNSPAPKEGETAIYKIVKTMKYVVLPPLWGGLGWGVSPPPQVTKTILQSKTLAFHPTTNIFATDFYF